MSTLQFVDDFNVGEDISTLTASPRLASHRVLPIIIITFGPLSFLVHTRTQSDRLF